MAIQNRRMESAMMKKVMLSLCVAVLVLFVPIVVSACEPYGHEAFPNCDEVKIGCCHFEIGNDSMVRINPPVFHRIYIEGEFCDSELSVLMNVAMMNWRISNAQHSRFNDNLVVMPFSLTCRMFGHNMGSQTVLIRHHFTFIVSRPGVGVLYFHQGCFLESRGYRFCLRCGGEHSLVSVFESPLNCELM